MFPIVARLLKMKEGEGGNWAYFTNGRVKIFLDSKGSHKERCNKWKKDSTKKINCMHTWGRLLFSQSY